MIAMTAPARIRRFWLVLALTMSHTQRLPAPPERRYGRIPCNCVCRCQTRFLGLVCACLRCLFVGPFMLLGLPDGWLPCRCER